MEPSKPFPIYQLQDAFEAFCNGEPAAKPQHRSLYYFLLGYCRRRGNTPRFSLAYEAGMHGSGIGSWATYDTALKALAEWGFIVYTPGANRYKVPVVELTFRNPTADVLLTYWQSYCLSTSNPTDNPTDDVLLTQVVTLKEVLKKEKEKVEKLESEKTQLQADVAAASAALADSQKKIEGLQFEIDNYAAELYSEPMPPGPQPESPQPELRTTGGAADVGTSLTPERGGRWQYDPAQIAANLVLPFDTPEFRQQWAAYRAFREEDKQRRLTGGMQEQELLRKLSNLAGGSQQKALDIIAQTIAKGWKDLYKLDEQRPSIQHPGQPERGAKPTAAASTGARALSAQLRAIREERSAQAGSHVDTGAAAGTHAGLGSAVPPGVGAPQGR